MVIHQSCPILRRLGINQSAGYKAIEVCLNCQYLFCLLELEREKYTRHWDTCYTKSKEEVRWLQK